MGADEQLTKDIEEENDNGKDPHQEEEEYDDGKTKDKGGGGDDEVMIKEHHHHHHQSSSSSRSSAAAAAGGGVGGLNLKKLQSPAPAAPLQVVVSRQLDDDDEDINHGRHVSATTSTTANEPSSTTSPPQLHLQGTEHRSRAPSLTGSSGYKDRLWLLLFTIHIVAVSAAIVFFIIRAIEWYIVSSTGRLLLKYWFPPTAAASFSSCLLALAWQKCIRTWPGEMVKIILYATLLFSFVAGLLLICISLPATAGIGFALILFSVCLSIYICWVMPRMDYASRILQISIGHSSKFRDLQSPSYLFLCMAVLWAVLWCMAVVGALHFYFPPLTIIGLVVSLAWTMEVMRNVMNLTVCRVMALYYLRGMQASVGFSLQRALTRLLGSACLGSVFLPTIEALRIFARLLNLLEGEDAFMFSCAHCCFRVMELVFGWGNGWAFVEIAAYGKGFVNASKSTWDLFGRVQGMEALLDSDITNALCFLCGVSSGSVCVIIAASWAYRMGSAAAGEGIIPTISLVAFFIGYLLSRISLALPQACVNAYYVCYAMNPQSRSFDNTIRDRIQMITSGRDKSAVPLVVT